MPEEQILEQRRQEMARAEPEDLSVPKNLRKRQEEKQVILVLRFVATSTGDIYTNEWMRRSGRRVRDLSTVSEVQ